MGIYNEMLSKKKNVTHWDKSNADAMDVIFAMETKLHDFGTLENIEKFHHKRILMNVAVIPIGFYNGVQDFE